MILIRTSIFSCVLVLCHVANAAPPRVHLEVVMADRLDISAPQRWLRMLQELPFASVRMRQTRSRELPKIERVSPDTIRVRALLASDGVLRVPDARFRIGDKQRLSEWLKGLSSADGDGTAGAFGLTAEQLVTVRRQLQSRVSGKTRGQPLGDVIQKIRSNLDITVVADAGAQARLQANGTVDDELEGVASGTALAAAVRPLGLAVVPQRERDGKIRLRITLGRGLPESWPVGWETGKSARDTIPKLFDFLQVEVVSTPLREALDALQARLEVPVLLDHNSLAAGQIRPDEIRVRFPGKRTFYKRVLDQVLFQARLEAQLRVDDADRPFIWVTTIGVSAPANR